MTSRVCPRCEQVLPFEADGSLMFCPSCGMPQITVSEQFLEEVQARRQLIAEGGAANENASAERASTQSVVHDSLRTAAVVGAGAALLALAAMPLPPMDLLLWLWVVGAPVIALGLFSSRRKSLGAGAGQALGPGFGARLGFLSGLAVTLCLAIVNTISLLLTRFVFHRIAPLDTQLAAVFTQVRTATEAQYGAAAAAPFTALLGVPEFRAGLLLCSMGMFTAAYLVLATVGGAFAGVLRGRTPQT